MLAATNALFDLEHQSLERFRESRHVEIYAVTYEIHVSRREIRRFIEDLFPGNYGIETVIAHYQYNSNLYTVVAINLINMCLIDRVICDAHKFNECRPLFSIFVDCENVSNVEVSDIWNNVCNKLLSVDKSVLPFDISEQKIREMFDSREYLRQSSYNSNLLIEKYYKRLAMNDSVLLTKDKIRAYKSIKLIYRLFGIESSRSITRLELTLDEPAITIFCSKLSLVMEIDGVFSEIENGIPSIESALIYLESKLRDWSGLNLTNLSVNEDLLKIRIHRNNYDNFIRYYDQI